MPLHILLMVLLSCVLHASWNLAARHWRHADGFLWGLIAWASAFAAATVPWTITHLNITPQLLLCALLASIGLGINFNGVHQAYLHGDISQVYPLIRTAPLWVSIASFFFLREPFGIIAISGVLMTVSGVFALAMHELSPSELRYMLQRFHAPAVRFALSAGLGTTIYTLCDKIAMQHADGISGAIAYRALRVPAGLLFWFLFSGRKASKGFSWKQWKVRGVPVWVSALCGLLVIAAFTLVTIALMQGGAGRVSAITNFAVVLGSLLGMILFKERAALRPRLLGLALTVTGIILLQLN
jgi:drug/metabolite transporter (DMT)-like permease